MDNKLIEKIHNMPKVELHLHIDGSLNVNRIKEKYNMTDEEIDNKMVAQDKCSNLNDYLIKFDFPISIMQTKEELENATIDLLNTLKTQNVVYAELRFAPQFHTKKGLSQDEVVSIVINAMKSVDIKSNLILCVMRGKNNEKENLETIQIAKKYLNKGVCAIDLAGAEAIYKTSRYVDIFKYAKELGIPFTIHAGEADGVSSIEAAILCGAKRIGHGVRAIEDDKLIDKIKEKNITLEVCPTSNIQTCVCKDYSTHPIVKLFEKGVNITINTDNMTVSNTTLEKEYINIIENTNITYNDICNMNRKAIEAAFLTDKEKEELLKKLI